MKNRLEQPSGISGNTGQKPIQPGEIFSPEAELKKIRQMPKKEKSEELPKFKEKLAYQKEGLAKMQDELIHKIRFNSDMPRQELYQQVEIFSQQFGLTSEQKDAAKSIIDEYIKRHKRIREIRKKYPDNHQLYLALFYRLPEGKIKVIEKPMSLCFICYNLEDYAWLSSLAFQTRRLLTRKDIFMAGKEAGRLIDHLATGRTIIIVNAMDEKEANLNHDIDLSLTYEEQHADDLSYDLNSTLIHEEQHAFDALFKKKFRIENFFSDVMEAEDDQTIKVALYRYFRFKREGYEDAIKKEILAYFKERIYSPDEILEILARPYHKDGLYDFYAEDLKDLIDYSLQELSSDYRLLIEKTVQDVFQKEYCRLIKNSIEACELLYEHDYPIEQVIALLISEPLPKWKKVVKRLLEFKKK